MATSFVVDNHLESHRIMQEAGVESSISGRNGALARPEPTLNRTRGTLRQLTAFHPGRLSRPLRLTYHDYPRGQAEKCSGHEQISLDSPARSSGVGTL